MLNRIGVHVGLKIFFQTNEIIEFGVFFLKILSKVTDQMCNCYL